MERTEQKLKYAEVHLRELAELERLSGDAFERAHVESCLFHTLGALDAFLAELNIFYEANLSRDAVTLRNLRDARKTKGLSYAEIVEIYQLQQNPNSWLSRAKAMRDHATHDSGIPRTFFVGGENDGEVQFKDPRSGSRIAGSIVTVLEEYLNVMKELIYRLRTSASYQTF